MYPRCPRVFESLPYHGREEGVLSCGTAPRAASSDVSHVVALRRLLQGRATLVRPRRSVLAVLCSEFYERAREFLFNSVEEP